MKILLALIFVFVIGLMVISAGAEETLIPVTKPGEVMTVDMVQVEISKPAQVKEIVTLSYINTQLAVLNARLQALQKDIAALKILKTKVEAVAVTVELKKEEAK